MFNLMLSDVFFKVTLSGQTRFLATGSSLKMMKNNFYLTLKVLLVFKILTFLSLLFAHVEKRH